MLNRKAVSLILMPLCLLIGLFLFTVQVVGIDFSFFPGGLGDGRLNLFFLEHNYQFFTGQISTYWDIPFMYPEKNVLAFSDNLLGSAPIYMLFRIFDFDKYASYQYWYVVVTGLNYLTAFYFLKYLTKDNYAAVLGAFVFAFSIALQSQITHAQTFPRYAIPLCLWMVVKFNETGQIKYFYYTLCFLVYQIYCGIYLGFMIFIPTGLILLITIIKSVKMKVSIRWYIAMLISCIANLILLLPIILPYIERKNNATIDYFRYIVHNIPTIRSHLFSIKESVLWNFLSDFGVKYPAFWDHQIFSGGLATIALLVLFLFLIKQLIYKRFKLTNLSSKYILLFSGYLTFILFIRFRGYSLYALLYFLPGFSSMRSLTRIINIELIFFAISVALLFASIRKRTKQFTVVVFFCCLVALIVDNYVYKINPAYRTTVSMAKAREKNLEYIFSEIPKHSVMSYEPDSLDQLAYAQQQIDAMLMSQKYHLKTINAYTGNSPREYTPYWFKPNKKNRKDWLNYKKEKVDTLYVVSNNKTVNVVID